MRDRSRLLLLSAFFVFFPAILRGQIEVNKKPPLEPGAHRNFAGKVLTPEGGPVSHATVAIANSAEVSCHAVQTNDRGEFRVDCDFNDRSDEIKYSTVTLDVTKEGFRPAHKMAEIPSSSYVSEIRVTLRPLKPADPTLLSQAELIKSLAPRLRQMGPDDRMPAGDEADYARGVQEFLDRNQLDRAVPLFSKVAKNNPSCLKCRTMLALAELAWGDYDDARQELTESVNALVADRKLAHTEPLLAYGVLVSWEYGPAKASVYFAEALKYAPQDALALQEQGRAQCWDSDWETGSESLRRALAAGAGPEARLMLADALLRAGATSQAKAELAAFLDGRDSRKMPPHVRALIERIREQEMDEAAFRAADAKARARGEQPIDYVNHPPKNLPDFEPASDQASLNDMLAVVGKNVSKLFDDLLDISAVENVLQEKVGQEGKIDSSRKFEYLYLCLLGIEKWGPRFVEYRSNAQGNEISQAGLDEGYMLTAGFVSAPLIFHPAHQKRSSFRLLGHQKLKARDTVVIAYAQNPARSQISGRIQVGKNTRRTFEQGIAWIDAENYQIMRLASDLLKPIPLIGLDQHRTEIEFHEVQLNRVTGKFWLPEHVTVTLHWNGKVFRNTHAYSNFRLFSVETLQKIEKPEDPERNAGETGAPVRLEK